MANNTPIVQIENLAVRFTAQNRTVEALRGISFEIYTDEILGVVGESGSGKSVTGLYMMGLLPANAEVVSGSMQPESNVHSSMIFQYPRTALNPIRKAGQQICDVLQVVHAASSRKPGRKELKQEALHWLEVVKIRDPESCYNAFPFQLSGGMCQRLLIAMALSHHPRMLIADEPTTALDVVTQKVIMQLLLDLKSQYSISVMFITHDLALAYQYCKRLIVMENGRIVETGDRSRILQSPQQEYTRRLVASSPAFMKTPQDLLKVEQL